MEEILSLTLLLLQGKGLTSVYNVKRFLTKQNLKMHITTHTRDNFRI